MSVGVKVIVGEGEGVKVLVAVGDGVNVGVGGSGVLDGTKAPGVPRITTSLMIVLAVSELILKDGSNPRIGWYWAIARTTTRSPKFTSPGAGQALAYTPVLGP